jgi:hypothetical protein
MAPSLSVAQVKLQGGEVIGAPTPADVMASASRTVLTKLDRVEGEVIDFFMPAASRLIAGPHPERVLAAALAAMSGFRYGAGCESRAVVSCDALGGADLKAPVHASPCVLILLPRVSAQRLRLEMAQRTVCQVSLAKLITESLYCVVLVLCCAGVLLQSAAC